MATEEQYRLIDLTLEDEEIQEALLDVSRFKIGFLNQFGIQEAQILEESGFKFTSQAITQRKADIRTFVLSHPEVQSENFTVMFDKITYWLSKKAEAEKAKRRRKAQKIKSIAAKHLRRKTVVSSSSSDEETPEEKSDKRSKASKSSKRSKKEQKPKKPKKIEQSSEESSDSDSLPDLDTE